MTNHSPNHSHTSPRGLLGWLAAAFHLHGHHHDDPPSSRDALFNANAQGIRTVWLALIGLGLTSVLQIAIVLLSGSVALFADTVHNIGDTLNSIPLLIAFYLMRLAATRRYTYGFGRAEDIAGILIVVSIAVSAAIIFWESVQKLFDPQPMQNVPWVVVASVIGFVGNEFVAQLQIRTGRRIGSDAMTADGLHARMDGLTSLAVLLAASGTVIGLPILDPIIGLVIGVAILFITKDAALRIWYRLMDAVDPAIISRMEHFASETESVQQVTKLRARWVGHELYGEMTIVVDDMLSLVESHRIAENARETLYKALPHLAEMTIHIDPSYEHTPADAAERMKTAAPSLLPPRYQTYIPSAAPMGAAALKLDSGGKVAWDEIWTDFCDLALAGGPPHRGSLLEPVDPEIVAADPEGYENVLRELERGIRMVTGLPVVRSSAPGWIGMECESEEMALWLLRAIIVENVMVRREGRILYFPASPQFKLESEIKNVITVIAKTNHYWKEHVS